MDDLADLLGQSAAVARLSSQMLLPGPQRVWLEGRSGTGKSTIVALTARALREEGATLTLVGDVGAHGMRFLPLHRALAGTRQPKKVRDALDRAAYAGAKAVPLVGHSAAELAQALKESWGTAKPEFLTADQQDLLQGLQAVAGKRRLFLFMDDVGWLDDDTARLLLGFSLPDVQNAYPFCKDVAILFAENLDARPTLDAALTERLKPAAAARLSRIGRRDFPDILGRFGLVRPLSDALADKLYAISEGHLAIMRQIAQIDRGADVHSILNGLDLEAFTRELLRLRLDTIPAHGTARLLSIAACAGSAVSKLELGCAFADQAQFPAALESVLRERLLIPEGESVRFVHEAVRDAAERLATPETRDYHARLASCLKLLRPGDYAGRLRHARLSGAQDAALELEFVVALQSARGEHLRPSVGAGGPLAPVLADAREAYRLMDAGDHRGAIELATRHYDGTHGLVQGEIVALIALNYIKRRTAAGYAAATALLTSWQHFTDEREIHERLMSILAAALSMSGETAAASQLNGELLGALQERAKSEPWARARAETLGRKADMFLSTELALKHIDRAVEYFGPAEGTEVPRNAFEYTSSLINLSGANYTLGRFSAGADAARAAIECINAMQTRGLRTAEPYKALNNYLIAAFRSGSETAEHAVAAFDLLVDVETDELLRDRSLFAINRGVMAILAGRAESGRRSLERAWTHVETEELDGYYALYAAANLAAARALDGDTAGALHLLARAADWLGCVPRWVQPFHRRRHTIVLAAVQRGEIGDAAEWDARPSLIHRAEGSQDFWFSIGRGFLMSDIQVWSEG